MSGFGSASDKHRRSARKTWLVESKAWWRLTNWRCLFGHKWRYQGVNVAPDVVSHITGGFDECARCGSCKDFWGYV